MSAPDSICEQSGGVISPGNPCVLSPQGAATGFGDWQYLINHRPTGLNWEIHNRIPDAPDPGYHAIEDAVGEECNLDFYPVQILELPKINNVWPAMDKTPMSIQDIVYQLRTNINSFVDSANCARFEHYDPNYDRQKWESKDPNEVYGAVISIKMLMFTRLGGGNPEDGSVITSEYKSDHWIFSTLWTPEDGAHPVSGNRQFGVGVLRAQDSLDLTAYGPCINKNGNTSPGVSFIATGQDIPYFYIRGADRCTCSRHALKSGTVFECSDALWKDCQVRVARWIESLGGKAHIPGSVWRQLGWNNDIKSNGLWLNPHR